MIIVLDEAYRRLAEERLRGHELRYFPPGLADRAAFSAMLADAEVLGMRRVLAFPMDREIVERAPRLKFIHKSGSGADHFDVEALDDLGILLALNTGFNAGTVAEHTVALVLICLRRTTEFAKIITEGRWTAAIGGDEPLLVGGKTIGLVGVGAIARHVARVMLAFDARVICHHPDPDKPMPPGTTWAPLDTLLSTADVVSLHVPLKADTAGMIGRRELALMQPSAVLINTSRGAVVDEPALVEALREKRLRAAGLDVFVQEPLPLNHPLRSLPNVVATPHVGGVAREIAALQVEGTIRNIELFVSGTAPERLVNPALLNSGRARARHHLAA